MNTKTFHLSGVDKAIYAAATTKFHEAQAPIHKAIMDKVRAALAAQEAEVLAKHRDALSILDLPCYTIQDGKVVEGTVRDHLRLFPQGTYTEPELSADAFSPELVLRRNIQVGVYEIVYLDEGTETLIAHATTMEALRPVYDSHLLQGILDNPRANIFWVRAHAEAACAQHAAPVVLPEPVVALYTVASRFIDWVPCTVGFARKVDGGIFEVEYAYTEQQVRELLANTKRPTNRDDESVGLREALVRAHDWMDSQADSQSKGGHATFDLMMLREERNAIKSALDESPQPQADTRDAERWGSEPVTGTPFLQEEDQHLLDRFIETTEDNEGFDIGKEAIKRLANLGVVESFGFGRYGVTMFGYWVHEKYWHQNPSLPLKTNADRDADARAAVQVAGALR